MQKTFLVAYAGKYGSTQAIAETIGGIIRGHGIGVDVLPCGGVRTLSNYDAVMIGSAVRFGAWMKEAVDFVKTNHQELAALPAAIFSVHILNRGDQEEHRAARAAYTAPIHSLITARAEAFFPGVIDMDKLSLSEKIISRAVKTSIGDFRDWEQIRLWGEATYRLLSPEQVHHQP